MAIKKHIESIYDAWSDFFSSVESLGSISELLFLWITSPFWIIPYSIYKRKEKNDVHPNL